MAHYDWRPITFQGVTFPATLMGISVLDSVLRIADEELGNGFGVSQFVAGSRRAPRRNGAPAAPDTPPI